jgi:hypothetical protein
LCNGAGIIQTNSTGEAAFWLADPCCLAQAHKSKNPIYMFWQLHYQPRAIEITIPEMQMTRRV